MIKVNGSRSGLLISGDLKKSDFWKQKKLFLGDPKPYLKISKKK